MDIGIASYIYQAALANEPEKVSEKEKVDNQGFVA